MDKCVQEEWTQMENTKKSRPDMHPSMYEKQVTSITNLLW